MKVDILLGLQWGDEGKGKIVDVITPDYAIIARFQGGPNAGHTLEFNGMKHVLHTIPSGIFHTDKENIVGNGVVIDPVIFKREVEALIERGVEVKERLLISRRAHLILPTHRLLDAASEQEKGSAKIGSTLKGIGPTYMDKTGRNGLRAGDLLSDKFDEKYRALRNKHLKLLSHYNGFSFDLDPLEAEWLESVNFLRQLQFIDSEHYLNEALKNNEKILAEGAQGSLLDIDFGSYPFVTSSNTVAAGACTGLGIAPNRIGEVFGIFKAYCTRVGSGPFPTELTDETGEMLRKKGHEFGATTGRPRRCGWLDLPALRYTIAINGVTKLIMTKADVLSTFDEVQVCTHYKHNGTLIDFMPYSVDDGAVEPVYQTLPGWSNDLTELRNEAQLPQALLNYIRFVEEALEVPIAVVSVGPDRTQTIIRKAVTA
jgi:adenylosuccinate synthase